MKRMPRGPRLQHCWKRRYDHYLVSCSNVMQGSSIELYSLSLVGMHGYFKLRDSFNVKQVGLCNRFQRTYGLSWPFKDNPVKFASDGSSFLFILFHIKMMFLMRTINFSLFCMVILLWAFARLDGEITHTERKKWMKLRKTNLKPLEANLYFQIVFLFIYKA